MTDSYGDSQTFGAEGDSGRDSGRNSGRDGGANEGGGREGAGGRGGARGGAGRGQGNRDAGGFRIRLSDNEMRATRALQEAFNLRSTVAVLGFAVRTLGQMLEDGELETLVEQQRSQAPRDGGRRGEGGRGEGRGEGRDGGRGGWRGEGGRGEGGRSARPDPFARPAKPQPPAPEPEPAADPVEPVTEEAVVVSDEAAPADVAISTDPAESSSEDAKTNEA